MTPARRQIVFINTAHTITHNSLAILPTAVLVMAVPGGPFGQSYAPILALATGMFVLYGLLSRPQGWLASMQTGSGSSPASRHRPAPQGLRTSLPTSILAKLKRKLNQSPRSGGE